MTTEDNEKSVRQQRHEKVFEYRNRRLDIVVSSAQSALKTAFIVNGAGTVALVGLFAQAIQKPAAVFPAATLAEALFLLIVGTGLAALATGFSFLAQYGYMLGKRRSWFGRVAPRITKLNIFLILLSYACFIAGGAIACQGLSQYVPAPVQSTSEHHR
jgi:hypothetical protein